MGLGAAVPVAGEHRRCYFMSAWCSDLENIVDAKSNMCKSQWTPAGSF